MELQNHKGIISDKCKSLCTSLNYIRNCSFNTFKFYGKKEKHLISNEENFTYLSFVELG